ncbi:biotin transporter BioY [Thorsellia anophelis]|uniref:Biotin transporter n=1 Tax=Thorsellia anophelis DSM 18579 TaxID=1123402 RepID=A0A1H9YNE5_9GAMM|nr:biotin transporter BioY [Thorsellia anophelis]SES70585.1 biotin transport system substrate-specific component [Thorsellia anophelis DSM 18579]
MHTKDIVYIALFTAFMAALGVFPPVTLSFIAIPITAQSLGPMLAGSILGAKRGALSILLFCLLVAIGLPLLSGGRYGIAVFLGPTAGFIYGWIVSAFFIGLSYQILRSRLNLVIEFIILLIGGIGIVYTFGLLWLMWITDTSFKTALLGMLIFIPGDMIKIVIALFITRAIKRAYPAISAV